jgi:hypothetical protein
MHSSRHLLNIKQYPEWDGLYEAFIEEKEALRLQIVPVKDQRPIFGLDTDEVLNDIVSGPLTLKFSAIRAGAYYAAERDDLLFQVNHMFDVVFDESPGINLQRSLDQIVEINACDNGVDAAEEREDILGDSKFVSSEQAKRWAFKAKVFTDHDPDPTSLPVVANSAAHKGMFSQRISMVIKPPLKLDTIDEIRSQITSLLTEYQGKPAQLHKDKVKVLTQVNEAITFKIKQDTWSRIVENNSQREAIDIQGIRDRCSHDDVASNAFNDRVGQVLSALVRIDAQERGLENLADDQVINNYFQEVLARNCLVFEIDPLDTVDKINIFRHDLRLSGQVVVNSFSGVLKALDYNERCFLTIDRLRQKLPAIARVYKHFIAFHLVVRSLYLSKLLWLSNEHIIKVIDAYDAAVSIAFSEGDHEDFEMYYVEAIQSPEKANSITLLALFDRKFNNKSYGRSDSDKVIHSNNICRFMLKLCGISADIEAENVADLWQVLNAFIEAEPSLCNLFNWAVLNCNKITDDLIKDLEVIRPEYFNNDVMANYAMLEKCGFSNTLTIARSALEEASSKVGDGVFADVSLENLRLRDNDENSFQIPEHRLRQYMSACKGSSFPSEQDGYLTLLSGGDKEVKSFLAELLDLDILRYDFYQTIIFRLDTKQQQILFDNFQCAKIFSSPRSFALMSASIKVLSELCEADDPKVHYQFWNLVVFHNSRSDYYSFDDDPSVSGSSYEALITNLYDKYLSLDSGDARINCYKKGLVAAAMWCKRQDRTECGQLLGKIVPLVGSCAQIVNGADLHPNVQEGFLMDVGSTSRLEYFNDSSDGFTGPHEKVEAGFSQVSHGG